MQGWTSTSPAVPAGRKPSDLPVPVHPNQAQALFLAVRDLDPSGRAAVLDVACGRDAALRTAAEALLEHPTIAQAFDAGLTAGDPSPPAG